MPKTRGEANDAMPWAPKQSRSNLTDDHPRNEDYDIEVPLKPELKTSRKERNQKHKPQTGIEPREPPEIPIVNEWTDDAEDKSIYCELFVKEGTGQTPISAVSMDDWFEDMYQSQLSQSSALGEIVDEEGLLAAFDLQMQLADPPGLSSSDHLSADASGTNPTDAKQKEKRRTKMTSNDIECIHGIAYPMKLVKDRSDVEDLAQMLGEDLAQMDNWMEDAFEAHIVSRQSQQPLQGGALSSKSNLNEEHAFDFQHEIEDHTSLVRLCMLKDDWKNAPSKHDEKRTSRRDKKPRNCPTTKDRRGSHAADSRERVLKHDNLCTESAEMPSWLQPAKGPNPENVRQYYISSSDWKGRKQLRGEWVHFIEGKRTGNLQQSQPPAVRALPDQTTILTRPEGKPQKHAPESDGSVTKAACSTTELEEKNRRTPLEHSESKHEKKKQSSRKGTSSGAH